MHFSRVVTANLYGRPVRSLLTVSGVAVAVGAVVALVGVSDGFQRSLKDAYASRQVDLVVLQAGKVQQTMSVLPETLGEQLAQIPEIETFSPALIDMVSLNEDDMMGVAIQAWPKDSHLLNQFNLLEGKYLTESGPKSVLIGKTLAQALHKKVGDSIEVYEGEPYEVVGVMEATNPFENGAMIMTLSELQGLMFREGEVTTYMITGKEHSEEYLEMLAEKIRALQPGLEVTRAQEYVNNARELQTIKAISWITSSIALVVGAVGILNTMLMAVFERTREIAMMRAVGWRRSRVMQLVMSEAMLLSLAGAVIGTLGAMALIAVLAQSPSAGRMVSGDVSPMVILQGFVVAIVLGFFAGLYPALRAARMTPIEGLRHE